MLAVISLYQKQAKSMFDHFCYTLDPVLNMEAEPTSLVDRNKGQFGMLEEIPIGMVMCAQNF